MKKLCALLLAGLLLVGCTPAEPDSTVESTEAVGGETRPAVEFSAEPQACNSMLEATKLAGFAMGLPDGAGFDVFYNVVPGELLEAVYVRDGKPYMTIRKGVGDGDVSAKPVEFTAARTLNMGPYPVTMLDNAGGWVQAALWTIDDFSFSIQPGPETLFGTYEITQLIMDIN